MSLIEQVTPGWSVTYPPKHRDSSSASDASDKPRIQAQAGLIYPSWSLTYLQLAPTEPDTAVVARDPADEKNLAKKFRLSSFS